MTRTDKDMEELSDLRAEIDEKREQLYRLQLALEDAEDQEDTEDLEEQVTDLEDELDELEEELADMAQEISDVFREEINALTFH